MDGFQPPQGQCHFEEAVYFLPQVPRYSWYSYYRPRKDEGLSRPWSHPVVLSTGPLDWESSALTTRPLLHIHIYYCLYVLRQDVLIQTRHVHIYRSHILLSTCATTRYAHLELTSDMSTSTLILALRRFLAKKGFPETFISDNLKSSKSVILKFLRNSKID